VNRTRRVVAAATLLVSAYLLALPFALSLFSRTHDAEKLRGYYRPLMSAKGNAHFRSNLRIVDVGGNELSTVTLPRLERDLGMTEAQFNTYVAGNDPHVAAFLKRAPEVVKYLNPATEAVLAQKANYRDADRFPVADVPVTAGPWLLLTLGIAMAVVGWLMWATASRIAMAVTVVVGMGLLVAPVALGWFHETDAAEKVAQAARPPFSAPVANAVVDDIYKFDAAFKEMRASLFPAIGAQLHKSPAELDAYLHESFPATMRLLDEWDTQMYGGAHSLSLSQVRFMDEFHHADATPYETLPWLFMAPGLVLFAAAAVGLLSSRDKRARAAAA